METGQCSVPIIEDFFNILLLKLDNKIMCTWFELIIISCDEPLCTNMISIVAQI